MLNREQIKNIKDAEKIVFSTSSKSGQPRSIWVIPSRVEQDRIILSNIQMNKTFENLKHNPKCFLNILTAEQEDLQYKIEGVAEIVNEGKLFTEIKQYEETENLPQELKVNAIIIVNIKNIEESNG